MLIKIDKDYNITMTRGDTFKRTLQLKKDSEIYTPAENDTIRFAMSNVFKGEKGYQLLIEKVIPNDTMVLKIDPSDTKDLNYGFYVYDLEITYADGTVETFADKKKFVITEEVK